MFSLAVCSEQDLQARKQLEGHPDWSFIVSKTCKIRGLCSVHKLVWSPYAEGSGAAGVSDSSTPCTSLSGAEGCTALFVFALQSSTFPQQQQSPLSSGKVILGPWCWVWSIHISVRWVCFPTLRIFTLKVFSILMLKADRDPCGQRCQAGAWLWSLLLTPIPVPGTTSPRDSNLLNTPKGSELLTQSRGCCSGISVPPQTGFPPPGASQGYPAPGCLLAVAMAVWGWD